MSGLLAMRGVVLVVLRGKKKQALHVSSYPFPGRKLRVLCLNAAMCNAESLYLFTNRPYGTKFDVEELSTLIVVRRVRRNR